MSLCIQAHALLYINATKDKTPKFTYHLYSSSLDFVVIYSPYVLLLVIVIHLKLSNQHVIFKKDATLNFIKVCSTHNASHNKPVTDLGARLLNTWNI